MHRDSRFGWQEAAAYTALPMLLACAFGARHLGSVLAGGLLNPDSYMRLVRLQAEIAAGVPLHVVARDGSGAGALLHWSHLLDMLLCLLAAPFSLWLPEDGALHAAGVLIGPLGLGLLGLAVAWASAPFVSRHWLWTGPLLVALSPALTGYALPGVVHHHVGIAIAATMTAGWAARLVAGFSAPADGWRMGTWAGVGIWLTPESMPLTLIACGIVWLTWLTDPRRRDLARAIAAAGSALALVVAAAFACDPPFAGYGAVEIDRLSVVLLGLGLAVCATGWITLAIDVRLSGPPRIAAALFAGTASLGIWAAAFPVVLGGPQAMLDPADWHMMMDHVTEMEPVGDIAAALLHLLTGSLAAMLFAVLGLRRRSLPLVCAALAAAACVRFGWMHQRFAAYPEVFGAVALPIALTEAERLATGWTASAAAGLRLAALGLFIAMPLSGVLLRPAHAAAVPVDRCAVSGLAPMLVPYAGQVVLADVSDTPELLYRTRVLTVASLYHRNMAAFHRFLAAWRSGSSATLPPELAATRASLLLFCARTGRSPIVADMPADTLLDRLNRGEVPPWLVPVADDRSSGSILYRVVR